MVQRSHCLAKLLTCMHGYDRQPKGICSWERACAVRPCEQAALQSASQLSSQVLLCAPLHERSALVRDTKATQRSLLAGDARLQVLQCGDKGRQAARVCSGLTNILYHMCHRPVDLHAGWQT